MKIQVNGITFHVKTYGYGQPLLLLHGFSGSHHSFDAFIPQWSQHFHVIAIDLIGHGDSEAPADPARYTIEHAVKDLIAVLDLLKLKEVALLGYSMGGRLALSLAMLAPDRVSKLILESSSPGLAVKLEREERIQRDTILADQIEREGIEWFVSYWEELPLFRTMKNMPENIQRKLRQQRLSNKTYGLANSLRGMGTGAQPSWWEHLDQLQVPVHLIAGEEDIKFIEIARKMQRKLPHSQFTQIAGAGHITHLEQEQAFASIVLKSLTEEHK